MSASQASGFGALWLPSGATSWVIPGWNLGPAARVLRRCFIPPLAGPHGHDPRAGTGTPTETHGHDPPPASPAGASPPAPSRRRPGRGPAHALVSRAAALPAGARS